MSAARVAIVCDLAGRILEDLSVPPLSRGTFPDLVPVSERARARAFLADLRSSREIFGRDLRFRGARDPLHFAGGLVGDRLLVVGAPSRRELAPLLDSLTVSTRGGPPRSDVPPTGSPRKPDERLATRRALVRRERAPGPAAVERARALGILAHDLRNALNLVLGFVGLLEEDEATLTSAERRELASRALEAGQDMTRLLGDLLDVSKTQPADRRRSSRAPSKLTRRPGTD